MIEYNLVTGGNPFPWPEIMIPLIGAVTIFLLVQAWTLLNLGRLRSFIRLPKITMPAIPTWLTGWTRFITRWSWLHPLRAMRDGKHTPEENTYIVPAILWFIVVPEIIFSWFAIHYLGEIEQLKSWLGIGLFLAFLVFDLFWFYLTCWTSYDSREIVVIKYWGKLRWKRDTADTAGKIIKDAQERPQFDPDQEYQGGGILLRFWPILTSHINPKAPEYVTGRWDDVDTGDDLFNIQIPVRYKINNKPLDGFRTEHFSIDLKRVTGTTGDWTYGALNQLFGGTADDPNLGSLSAHIESQFHAIHVRRDEGGIEEFDMPEVGPEKKPSTRPVGKVRMRVEVRVAFWVNNAAQFESYHPDGDISLVVIDYAEATVREVFGAISYTSVMQAWTQVSGKVWLTLAEKLDDIGLGCRLTITNQVLPGSLDAEIEAKEVARRAAETAAEKLVSIKTSADGAAYGKKTMLIAEAEGRAAAESELLKVLTNAGIDPEVAAITSRMLSQDERVAASVGNLIKFDEGGSGSAQASAAKLMAMFQTIQGVFAKGPSGSSGSSSGSKPTPARAPKPKSQP